MESTASPSLPLDLLGSLRRTHNCGELRPANVGASALLMGWVHRRRDLGGLIFIHLRDRDGITQIVFNPEFDPEAHAKAELLRSWMKAGKINAVDPRHLIFSIWSTTQHYADFDAQVRVILGPDRGAEGRFEDAARYLETLFLDGLRPKASGGETPRIRSF